MRLEVERTRNPEFVIAAPFLCRTNQFPRQEKRCAFLIKGKKNWIHTRYTQINELQTIRIILFFKMTIRDLQFGSLVAAFFLLLRIQCVSNCFKKCLIFFFHRLSFSNIKLFTWMMLISRKSTYQPTCAMCTSNYSHIFLLNDKWYMASLFSHFDWFFASFSLSVSVVFIHTFWICRTNDRHFMSNGYCLKTMNQILEKKPLVSVENWCFTFLCRCITFIQIVE